MWSRGDSRKIRRERSEQTLRRKIKCILLSIVGFIALVLGFCGIVLPLVPTTPLVLLAVFCFSYASPKMAMRLRGSRLFGAYLDNWYNKTGVTRSYKIRVLTFLWLGIGSSMYIVNPIWLTVLLGFIGLCVSIHILLIKTRCVPQPSTNQLPSNQSKASNAHQSA